MLLVICSGKLTKFETQVKPDEAKNHLFERSHYSRCHCGSADYHPERTNALTAALRGNTTGRKYAVLYVSNLP